jgi:glycosyltransferase involved in cell wall biosynthesis
MGNWIDRVRIAHVVDSMETGGAEVLVAALCRLQRTQGEEVSVHCLVRRGILGERLAAEGVRVDVYGAASRLGLMRRLRWQFQQGRAEVVHCHNLAATVMAVLPARMAGAVVIATRHGLVPPPYRWCSEAKFSLAARLCRYVVAVCETAHHNLARAPLASRSRIVTVYNGAPARPPTGGPSSLPPKDGFTVVHVARLTQAKDQVTLLRAIHLASPRIPDLQLWVLGDGVLRPQLELLVAELAIERCVHFFGEREDVGNFLAQADLFVLSSVSEGLPVSLLEAMAAALPVVVTDVGGMPELVRPSNCGAVVPPSDPQALADALCRLAEARSELPALGHAARSYYLEHFTLETMARRYAELYRSAGFQPLSDQTLDHLR